MVNLFYMLPNKKYFCLIFFIGYFPSVFAQDIVQKKLDSIESVIFLLDKKDTTQIKELGTYIVEKTSSERQRYRIFSKISEAYFRANDITKSIAYLFNAKEVAEKLGDAALLAQAYGSIANQYSYLNLNEKARTYLNQAIAQIEKLPEGKNKHRLKALSYIELGNLDFNNDSFEEANLNYRKSLAEFNKTDFLEEENLYHYRRSLYNIGNSYYYLKLPDSAEAYLLRALEVKDPQRLSLQYYIYSTLGEVYTLRGNYQQSIDTLQTILNDVGFDISSLKSEIYLNLSKNYKELGDNSNYALYNEKYLQLQEQLKGEDLKAISTAFNVEQKDFITSISQSKQRNRWLILCIIFIILVSLGGIFYLNRKKKKEKQIYQAIIARLENQVTSSAEEEIKTEGDAQIGHNIPSSVENEILEKLRRFEKSEKFRNPKLTLSTMAVQLKTNPTYLSTIIKAKKDQNFNSYINELRIGYICEKIHRNSEYLNYKISYLAEECGFASHSTFSTIFKNVTGISPSVFLREEEKRHSAVK